MQSTLPRGGSNGASRSSSASRRTDPPDADRASSRSRSRTAVAAVDDADDVGRQRSHRRAPRPRRRSPPMCCRGPRRGGAPPPSRNISSLIGSLASTPPAAVRVVAAPKNSSSKSWRSRSSPDRPSMRTEPDTRTHVHAAMSRAARARCSTSSTALPSAPSPLICSRSRPVGQLRRQVGGGLVEDQHARVEHQHARDRQHLPLAAAQLVGAALEHRLELREHLEHLLDAGADLRLGQQVAAHVEVLERP